MVINHNTIRGSYVMLNIGNIYEVKGPREMHNNITNTRSINRMQDSPRLRKVKASRRNNCKKIQNNGLVIKALLVKMFKTYPSSQDGSHDL